MADHPQRIRVVIPAFRATGTIRACVEAICTAPIQAEIVVVDDGENPGLDTILQDLPATILRTIRQGSAAKARNIGCRDFFSGIIVFIDADVLVEPDCIGMLIQPIASGEANAAVGNYSHDVRGLNFGATYKQLYISRVYDRRSGYLENDFWTAAGAIDAAAFHAIGGFDPHFAGACGEDGDLGVRLTAAGYRIIGLPEARARHRHPLTLQALFSNDWRKGMVALQAHGRSGGRLSDNKHATARDVVSVMLGVAALGAAALIDLVSSAPLVLLAGLYIAARGDIVRKLLDGGLWFAVRALWLMLALDLLRFACVAFCAVGRLRAVPHPHLSLGRTTRA